MTSWTDVMPQTTDGIAGERRYDRRYDIELDVRWKLLRRRKVVDTGTGRTVDLSSGGILFEAGRALPPGLDVELSVSWPVLLHDVAPLQLVVTGRIVRSDERHVALRTIQHEFRTMASPEHRQTQASGMDRGFRQ
jgi:c-di-GMP-binding flagellar brake protein YcgR